MQALSQAIDFLRTSLLSGKEALEADRLVSPGRSVLEPVVSPAPAFAAISSRSLRYFSRLAVRLCDGMIVAVVLLIVSCIYST